MNQADVSKLMSQLRIKVNPRLRRLKNPAGPEGRMLKLRQTLTALVKHERLELNFNRADETRMYAECLVMEAMRHGDKDPATMELIDFWMLEKQLVHKVFKVLVPRFQDNIHKSFTRMYKAPREYPGWYYKKTVLEFRDNPFPPLKPDNSNNRNLIHNVLLEEAKREYRKEKYLQMAEQLNDNKESQGVEKNEAQNEKSTIDSLENQKVKIDANILSSNETSPQNTEHVNK